MLEPVLRARELESGKALRSNSLRLVKTVRKRSVLLYMSIPRLFLTQQGRRAAARKQVLRPIDDLNN